MLSQRNSEIGPTLETPTNRGQEEKEKPQRKRRTTEDKKRKQGSSQRKQKEQALLEETIRSEVSSICVFRI